MDYFKKIMGEIEVHSVEGIRECFENGVSPNDYFNNGPLIYELPSEYLRSPGFKDCVKAFVDFGWFSRIKYCFLFYWMMPLCSTCS
jgi:hypothetical protein